MPRSLSIPSVTAVSHDSEKAPFVRHPIFAILPNPFTNKHLQGGVLKHLILLDVRHPEARVSVT